MVSILGSIKPIESSVLNRTSSFEYFASNDVIGFYFPVGRDPPDIFRSSVRSGNTYAAMSSFSLLDRRVCCLFVWLFCFFHIGATPLTRTGQTLTTCHMILAWSLRPTTTDVLMKTSSAPYNCPVSHERCLSSPHYRPDHPDKSMCTSRGNRILGNRPLAIVFYLQ